jgi:hypothetical protein
MKNRCKHVKKLAQNEKKLIKSPKRKKQNGTSMISAEIRKRAREFTQSKCKVFMDECEENYMILRR